MTQRIERTVDIQRCDIAVRWKSVTFPFEQWKLLEVLPEQGYVVEPGTERIAPFGARSEVTGLAAHKGPLYLSLDAIRPGLGVGGRDPVDVVAEFERVEEFLLKTLRFESRLAARFYECDVQTLVWSDGNPVSSMRAKYPESALLRQVASILQHPLAHYGFRFATSETNPGDVDWHEVHIEPSIRSPEQAFFGFLVFRKAAWQPVKDVALRAETIFSELGKTLEAT